MLNAHILCRKFADAVEKLQLSAPNLFNPQRWWCSQPTRWNENIGNL